MSTTDDTTRTPQALTEAEERRRHREEARLIRTREAAARKNTASKDGQWAAGDRTPLNPNEEFKATADPLEVRHRIETLYSKWGFWSIPPSDLRGRFRWWGLYTQRRPGIDGGRTAVLEPHQLDDEYFMLRIRSDGGQLSVAQAREIAAISTEMGRDTADVSDRQNIQLHWIRIEDAPEIFRRVESVGLFTTEACGDSPRVILGSPLAGVAQDELIDPTPQIQAIIERGIGNPEFSNLPRKFKSAISGMRIPDIVHEINDIAFVAVEHPELGVGYDLWVGGGLSINPHLGVRLGAFVEPDKVADVWAGVIGIFRDHGYRRLRTRARLKFVVKAWGAEKFREVLENDYLGWRLPDGPAPQEAGPGDRGDHVGIHRQRDGRWYVGVAPVAGRISGTKLAAIADIAEAAGSDRIRLTPLQKIVLLDIPEDRVNDVVNGLRALELEAEPGEFHRNVMACTGIEYCKLAIVETKATAREVVLRLDETFPTLDTPISVHVNGCPNSCARIQVADIGFKGQLVLDDETGEQVPGFQVHLGGRLGRGEDNDFGRKIRAHKVKADGMPDYVERVTRNYLETRADGEPFADWAFRVDEELIR
ncbi:nitrite/sulfite reductase [Demequina lignilytica]|uniref:assimilatory sulfite reductase (ferredoxin) n=1 Tax=Demequina lignilytica TaxID=3051663 RepID=A0AAW7M4U0_9MICO|nr:MULTISPECIES: nitrite/sulfite reductase [unclassified Demequina]MDN4478050.1 nitrite/sulfite reductase [Demequina sp. SYSU T00039-1]MDN4482871.1 nitrite/sulfite reductase [Demequina sp. SYSU T0a273]MDN4488500.1 nitrite/sulfite reductase [Demequina sp. SYSU T00039]MDN4489953.1 nitrite/sulfite reductase [Demequina sp. SYSU T00068]